MHVERKRIFIGNLPPSVNENDIREQFSNYGNIINIEIKHRKDNINEDTSPVFAFVTLETNNRKLQTCFQEISDYNWQGYYVKLEIAKESFLERLKREREEAQNKSQTNNISTTSNDAPINNNVPPTTITNNVHKRVYKSSSSSEESESDEEEKSSTKTNETANNICKNNESSDSSESEEDKEPIEKPQDGDISLIIKNNKNKYLTNGKIKIESFNSTPIHIIGPKVSALQKKSSTNTTPRAEKLLKSLDEKKESYNHQKQLIKNALSKVDSKQTNKILFDNSDDEGNSFKKRKYNNDTNSESEKRMNLFDDDANEDDSINFGIKNQFEGKKGQKLFQLQSRFTNDKRFTLDSRFADEDENVSENVIDPSVEDERETQLNILEEILHKKIRTSNENKDETKKIPKGMLRFDPSKPEHSKFEIKDKPNDIERETEKRSKNEETLEEEPKMAEIPEVSKEQFYKVSDNLTQSLKQNEGFSLLNMFGKAPEHDEETFKEDSEAVSQEIIKDKFDVHSRNPFRYDSSDTEDEQEHVPRKKITNDSNNESGNRPLWGEKFFFKENDERYKEGLNFLKQFSSSEKKQNFSETRREIKQIIRAKIRNVQRHNRPFRKKLGSQKHNKFKKARKS